ncbi:unnamed protein product [Trichogramma brassicae]|uniref:Uncharacterized protein n=1 Tax=Trichogramma brassicae TaxID=86971 RepID=A0A6H5I7T5_9HYME|nr:unnamed protein product [Trichogramma brassicae]
MVLRKKRRCKKNQGGVKWRARLAGFLAKKIKEALTAALIQNDVEEAPSAAPPSNAEEPSALTLIRDCVEEPPILTLTRDEVIDRVRNRRSAVATSTHADDDPIPVLPATTSDPPEIQGLPDMIAVVEVAPHGETEQDKSAVGTQMLEAEATASTSAEVLALNEDLPAHADSAVDPRPEEKKKPLDQGVAYAEWRLIPIDIPEPAYRRVKTTDRPTCSRSKTAPKPAYNSSKPTTQASRVAVSPGVTYTPTPKAELARRRREEAAKARALLRPPEEVEDIFASGRPVSEAEYSAWKKKTPSRRA